jgi:putative NADH-flavin reductase
MALSDGGRPVLVLGPSGGTGQQVVAQALEAGHRVTAIARAQSKISLQHPNLHLVIGSVTDDGATLADAMRGQEAVISALGRGGSLKSDGLIQRSVPAILSAMHTSGVRRLIFTSAIGVGDAIREAPFFSRMMTRFLLKDLYVDKAIGEDLIRRSDVDWTIVQPAQLTNGPLTRRYRAGEALKFRGMPRISRADVAHFLLSQLDDTSYIRKVARLGY